MASTFGQQMVHVVSKVVWIPWLLPILPLTPDTMCGCISPRHHAAPWRRVRTASANSQWSGHGSMEDGTVVLRIGIRACCRRQASHTMTRPLRRTISRSIGTARGPAVCRRAAAATLRAMYATRLRLRLLRQPLLRPLRQLRLRLQVRPLRQLRLRLQVRPLCQLWLRPLSRPLRQLRLRLQVVCRKQELAEEECLPLAIPTCKTFLVSGSI